MDRNPAWLYKTLVVGVIVLFIGVGIQPAFATVQPDVVDTEYFDVNVEFCGLGENYTVQLTKKEVNEVKQLFDSIREKINNSKTREETELIFKESIVELDKYGLLGNLSVKQAESLVFKHYKKFEINNNENSEKSFERENFFCLLLGKNNGIIDAQGPIARISHLFAVLMEPIYFFWVNHSILYKLFILSDDLGFIIISRILVFILLPLTFWPLVPLLFSNWVTNYYDSLPFNIGAICGFGREDRFWHGVIEVIPASGWLDTYGANGHKNWSEYDGDFYGRLPVPPFYSGMFLLRSKHFPGVSGFTGLNFYIRYDEEPYLRSYFIGSALWFKIGSEPLER